MTISRRDKNAFARVGAEGGKTAAANMTKAAKKARASKAAKARWAKGKEKK